MITCELHSVGDRKLIIMPKNTKAAIVNRLHKAIQENDMTAVLEALQRDPSLCLTDPCIAKGDTALHVAARYRCTHQLVTHLLSLIDVDTSNNDGKTALHEAASAGNTDVISTLLDHNATVDALKMADW